MGHVHVKAQGEGSRCVATETEPRVLDHDLESVVSYGDGTGRC
jgi:hypothetical protein